MHTSKSIPAARLLRTLGLRIHAVQASSLTPLSIPGNNNTMADISSCAFQIGHLLENIDITVKADLSGDVLRVWEEVDNGTTAKTARTCQKYWKYWQQYVTYLQCNPYLTDASPIEHSIILTTFAARVQTSFYGQGAKVCVSLVAEALASISKTCKLDGQ
eukprot:3069041-Ditylum_brightwellii.AAC.1